MLFDPKIKPRIWNLKTGTVAYNCIRMGLPMPVLAMPFWEGVGGKVFDYSSGQYHGTITGNTFWTSSNNGNCLEFDGSGDYVALGSAINSRLVNPLTVMIRMRADANDDVSFMNRTVWNGSEGFYLFTLSGHAGMRGSGTTRVETIENIIGEWHLYTYIFDSTVGTIYVDGKYNASGTIEAIVISTAEYCNIGRYNASSAAGFLGQISEVVIFPCVLNAVQINTFRNNSYGIFEPPRDYRIWSFVLLLNMLIHNLSVICRRLWLLLLGRQQKN
jgi:hypothetical protein